MVILFALHDKVVNESRLADVYGHGHQHGPGDPLHRVHGHAVHGGDVVDLRQRLGLDVLCHGGDDLVRVRLALSDHLLAQEHGLGQDQGGLPLGLAQVGVPGGLGQAVGLADDGATHDLDAVGQVPHHLADDGQLLRILLAEERLVGSHDVEQLGDDGTHTPEVDGAGLAAQLLGHVGQDLHISGRTGGIHLLHGGVEDHSAAVLLQQGAVPVKVAGIGFQILVGAKLGGVDKVGGHHAVTLAHGLVHQTGVALVQVSHGGHQANGQALFLPGGHLCADLGNGSCNDHGSSPLFIAENSLQGIELQQLGGLTALQTLQDLIGAVALGVGLGGGGEGSILHLGVVGLEGIGHDLAHLGKVLDKLGGEGAHGQHILPHEHLTVARGPGPDADGDDVQLPGDERRQLRGHTFQHHGEGSGGLDRHSVGQHAGSALFALALDLEAAKGMVGLGGHAHVGADGDAGGGDGPDLVADLTAAL